MDGSFHVLSNDINTNKTMVFCLKLYKIHLDHIPNMPKEQMLKLKELILIKIIIFYSAILFFILRSLLFLKLNIPLIKKCNLYKTIPNEE